MRRPWEMAVSLDVQNHLSTQMSDGTKGPIGLLIKFYNAYNRSSSVSFILT